MGIQHNFYRITTGDGGSSWALTDTAPEWLRDAVQEMHDDETPNSWRWDTAHDLAVTLDEAIEYGAALADWPAEVADQITDIYYSDLAAWLAGDHTRSAYVEEAVEIMPMQPGEPPNLWEWVRLGQYLALERMAGILLDAYRMAADRVTA